MFSAVDTTCICQIHLLRAFDIRVRLAKYFRVLRLGCQKNPCFACTTFEPNWLVVTPPDPAAAFQPPDGSDMQIYESRFGLCFLWLLFIMIFFFFYLFFVFSVSCSYINFCWFFCFWFLAAVGAAWTRHKAKWKSWSLFSCAVRC